MSGIEAVLGLVSAGAGLLSLTIQLGESIQKLKAFIGSAENSPEMLRSLVFDLETMALCLDQLERHLSQDTEEAELIKRCRASCQMPVQKINRIVNSIQTFTARHSRLGKVFSAFRDPEIAKLLEELEHAKSSLSVSLLMFYSQQQARQHRDQTKMLQYQNAQLQLIWTQTQTNSMMLSRISNAKATQNIDGSIREYEWQQSGDTERKNTLSPRRNRRGKDNRWSVRLPPWLCSQVWNFSVTHSKAGWDINIRTHFARPAGSEIFIRCFTGDVKAVQSMIARGDASVLDATERRESFKGFAASGIVDAKEGLSYAFGGFSLLDIAVSFGRVELCEWLIKELRYQEANSANLFEALAHGDQEPILRLLIERGQIDIDLDPALSQTKVLLTYTTGDCLESVLAYQLSHDDRYPPQQMFEQIYQRDRFLPAGTFLKIIGTTSSSPQLATFDVNGFSILHFAARMLVVAPRDLDLPSAELQDWLDIILTALKYGAEPSRIHRPASDCPLVPATPLFDLVAVGCEETSSSFQAVFQIWLVTMQKAGIDICEYGERESTLWRTHEFRTTLSGHDTNIDSITSLNLTYGPCPEEWELSASRPQYIRLYRLEQMPGSFERNPYVPSEICWPPDAYYDDDFDYCSNSTWKCCGVRIIWQKPYDVFRACSEIQERCECPRAHDPTRDDTDPIVLVATRSSRPAPSTRRSRSVPPKRFEHECQHCAEQGVDIRYALVTPTWHRGIHFCVATMAYEHSNNDKDIRRCLNGVCRWRDGLDSYPQACWDWSRKSFLAEIRDCLDGLPDKHSPSLPQHSGDERCSLGCDDIKFQKLHVPEPLRVYHPHRRFPERWSRGSSQLIGPARP